MLKKYVVGMAAALCCTSSFAASYPMTDQESPWMVRVRGIWVKPDVSSTTISGINGNVTHLSSNVMPEVDFTYFFKKNWAAELILATTQHHGIATGTTLGNVDLGKVWILPPTLTMQYHFMPDAKCNPYVGAGVNYTWFYNVDKGPLATSVAYKDNWGGVLQAGVDYQFKENWYFNVDVKKVFLKSDVTVVANASTLNTTLTLNPWIVGVGVGYRA